MNSHFVLELGLFMNDQELQVVHEPDRPFNTYSILIDDSTSFNKAS